ncbi:MAG: hypothetical protein RIM99_09235 [Cyclobacteriaceae bacterium]
MRFYQNTRPSQGVAFKPWADRIKELFEEQELEMPEKRELVSYYHANLSYEEVLNKIQFRHTKNVWMELNVKHKYGLFNIHFSTSTQAREFFKKFPELREELEKI